ncbi:MAG: AAA family ATPase [Legionellales bacterium]|nr:AAA family ATPase [Legionellales bacterium]|tara:strand:- start:76751 stop:78211 length:1461 start_codon:yes stop_codon:yes gene_type:complete
MGVQNIIGRRLELAFLDQIWQSKEAEFVAVYGRRRVGKTHLIREYFSNKGVYFELTGIKDGAMGDQLLNYTQSLADTFYSGVALQPPASWREAFNRLTDEIAKQSPRKKITIFLDELPWLASKRSRFIQNLDYFWNTRWSRMPNLKLIVCGSAASWMLDNLINAKGGLYNRLTNTLLLQPYDLSQTKEFLAARQIKLSHKQILDTYMITGGIPHYLKQIKKSKSAVQNINDMCFKQDGLLYDEFNRLFASLFENAELNLNIVREIAKARYGLSIQTLSQRLGKKTGGTFTKRLSELEAAGFIQKYLPYGRSKRDQYYRVIDEYTYFYLNWVEPYKEQSVRDTKANYWHLAAKSPQWRSWSGYTFESICQKHIHKIRQALNLMDIHCQMGHWQYSPIAGSNDNGAQIDLLIARDDGIVSLCEIKYSNNKLQIDKKIAKNLLNKIDVYQKQFPDAVQVSVVLVSTMGIKANVWSDEIIDSVIELEDLF